MERCRLKLIDFWVAEPEARGAPESEACPRVSVYKALCTATFDDVDEMLEELKQVDFYLLFCFWTRPAPSKSQRS